MPGAMGRRTPARRARGARVVSAPKAIAGADMCLAFTLAIHAPCAVVICMHRHVWSATHTIRTKRCDGRRSSSAVVTLHARLPVHPVRCHSDTVIQLSTFERITLDTRAVCVCACAPLACAREIETLNVRALLDIDNIIERSVRAPFCDEHLRASTCLAANYLIGK